MEKYRRKPIEVEAIQWFKHGDHSGVTRFYTYQDKSGQLPCKQCGNIMQEHGWIETRQGGHLVCPGDYIVHLFGEIYPCKPDVFEGGYEPVEASPKGE